MKTKRFFSTVITVLILGFINAFSATEQVFFDDFETSFGWVCNAFGTDNATTGLWERDDPQETVYGETMQMGTTVSGAQCLVTGHLAGSSPGEYDIDGGKTSARSPNITLPSEGNITLSFSYYFAHYSNATSDDYLRVKVVGSTTQLVLEELGSADIDEAVWETFSISLNDFSGQTVYILIEAADEAGASLVEAGVEDVLIESSPECGNGVIDPGETCENCPADVGPCQQELWGIHSAHIFNEYNYNTGSVFMKRVQIGNDVSELGYECALLVTGANMINNKALEVQGNVELFGKIESFGNIETYGNLSIYQGELYCDSKVYAREVIVTLDPFPDYVFAKDYKLMTLVELEKYIKENRHLPGIPKESEVKKEGLNIGEMQAKLLEKIEEMTLHMIQLQKHIDELEAKQNERK
jgi:hypothetical protein